MGYRMGCGGKIPLHADVMTARVTYGIACTFRYTDLAARSNRLFIAFSLKACSARSLR